MGFLARLLRRTKYRDDMDDNWEDVVYDRNNVNFEDQEERSRYISGCLEQMDEANREMNLLTGEYSLITSYLADMEEIEALPEAERAELNSIAGRLVTLEKESKRYQGNKRRMSDTDFGRVREQEDNIQEGISKLRECEAYGEKIRLDLQRLDRERHAYEYRRQELEALMNNLRGMTVIFLTAFVLCMIMLMVLQFALDMNTKAGYLLAVAAVAVAATVVWVKYTDGDRELHQVELDINKLIQLQNKVKIRYVNNKNLTDYLYMKYGTDSVATLEKRWKCYQKEKEERRQYAEAEAKAEYYRRQLLGKISHYRVVSPERWVGQAAALLDKREMVEMRHDLILRRQTLRKQMDYNNHVAEDAMNEIMGVANQYSDYASEIMEMVEQYRQDSAY